MSETYDVAIVGAGPAGMSAAITAMQLGAKTVVLDEQPSPGGQIYRNIRALASRPSALRVLGEDYEAGIALARRFEASGVHYFPLTQVWEIDGTDLGVRNPSGVRQISANRTIVATGAYERPFPIPGWTLPGVMTCGAAQTLLKGAGLAWGGRLILAGSGPLLLLLAVQLVRAGVKPTAVVQCPTYPLEAAPYLPSFLAMPSYALKGMGMIRYLRSRGVPFYRGATGLQVLGETRAEGVRFSTGRGGQTDVQSELVLLHHGVVPNIQLAMSRRCEHHWSDMQRAFVPKISQWGESSVEGIYVAGDSSGIAGALAAEESGRLAALSVAEKIGRIGTAQRDEMAQVSAANLRKHQRARRFLDAYFHPAEENLAPPHPDTVVCRCEEVRAGEVRRLVREQNCPGPNQMKAFVRSGMGPCQGRLCGLSIVELIAQERNISHDEVGYYRIRSPIKPITLAELAKSKVAS